MSVPIVALFPVALALCGGCGNGDEAPGSQGAASAGGEAAAPESTSGSNAGSSITATSEDSDGSGALTTTNEGAEGSPDANDQANNGGAPESNGPNGAGQMGDSDPSAPDTLAGSGGRASTGSDAVTNDDSSEVDGQDDATENDAAQDNTTSTAGNTGVADASGDATNGTTVSVTPSDYVERKWARWPIPNPPSAGLPHPMSYTETADGILDDITGLVWQTTTNSSTTTWAEALEYCETLGDGWSLPTRIELSSILDNTVSGPKVQAQFDFGNGAGWTWTRTPWVVNERRDLTGDAALSWFINFAVGDSNNSLSQTAASAYSRCVKLPASRELAADHYAVSDAEVADNFTGLTWQRAHSGQSPTLGFEDAVEYCEALQLGNQTWRLPSLNELASLVDDVPSGDVSPAIDHEAFPDTAPDAQYWSQSSYGTNTDEHWTLNFEDGFTAHRDNSTPGIARCVR